MSKKIENPYVHIEGSEGFESIHAGFDMDGKRFHVWLTPMGELKRSSSGAGILYCNPPRHIKRHDVGHFPCRKLDPDNKANRPLIKQLLEAIDLPGELAKHKLRQEDERQELERAAKEKELKTAIEQAGPCMLDILASIRTQASGDLSDAEFRRYVSNVILPNWVDDLIEQRDALKATSIGSKKDVA